MDVENILQPNELKTSIPYAILFPENVLTDTDEQEEHYERTERLDPRLPGP